MSPIEGSSWVRRLQPAPRRRRLACFPHVGGAASYFAPLARALSGTVEVLALQYPGRQERLREPCITSIAGLAAAVLPELRVWLDRPFALFGHSMGAVVAFEVARLLEEEGREPAALVVSGRRGPTTWRDEQLHRQDDDQLLAEVARLAGTPPSLLADEDVRAMVLPALRGDYTAIETYTWRPGPPLRCPLWALAGEDDPLTTKDEAAAWHVHTRAAFELRTFPGGHFYLADHLPGLVALLTEVIG